jgi:hypothetical protein
MYAADFDGDGDNDIFSADWAHGYGLAWYENDGTGANFTKHYFMQSPAETGTYGNTVFSQPHAAQVADMDGDGVKDIVVGKMRFAHPDGYGDPDLQGTPYLYVFKTLRDTPGPDNSSISFEPHMVSDVSGVGRQFAVGHLNGDSIMDICVSSKLGLYVYLGQ